MCVFVLNLQQDLAANLAIYHRPTPKYPHSVFPRPGFVNGLTLAAGPDIARKQKR